MVKKFTKSLLIILFCFAGFLRSFGQTITVSAFDPGPYGQGSTIGVPFQVNTTGGCVGSNNVFTLYLSDASGSFAAQRNIGTFTGFYGTFVNGIIPSGTPAGSGYRVRVAMSSPAQVSAASAPFQISSAAGVTAAISSQILNTSYPEVFGRCIGQANSTFSFVNEFPNSAATTASFYNELDKVAEGSINVNGDFIAKAAHYTVMAKATRAGGIIGTKAYLLINNVVNNTFGASGSTTVCLNGRNSLTYNVDIASPNGIQRNFPGLTYRVTWGDGATSVYTLCDIVNGGGQISHAYTKSSCGNQVNGQVNVFQVDLQPLSQYCGAVVTQVTTYAKVLAPPQNRFRTPLAACINSPVTFDNTSVLGQDPNATTADCENVSALYTWLVDGVVVATNYPVTRPLVRTFTSVGTHTVTLRLQNNTGNCPAPDATESICIQNPPQPSFTLPVTTICSANTLTPVNTSPDPNPPCNNTAQYQWVVTGPAAVSYSGGTNANSKNPSFLFNAPGIYEVRLDINSLSCGLVSSPTQTVTVNSSPVAKLSNDAQLCGNNITLNFNNNPGLSNTTLTGTQTTLPTTYNWVITGGAYSFTGGTTANSRYPQILFSDYATYNVTVTHTNNCGTATDTQQLTFALAPTVNAGADQTICENSPAQLAGSITGGAYNSFAWVGGDGTFTPNRTTFNATYTPTAAEVAAGQVILTLRAQTSLSQCAVINDDVVINITKKDDITSPATQSVCTQQNFTYTITSNNPATTFNWTTALTSGSATGFGATGSGSTINDLITNNSSTTDAVITYTITPTTNGCVGNAFQMRLTVRALPVATATAASNQICSNQPAGINFSSNVAGTTFLWTSTASAGISGNTNPTTPVSAGSIADVLVNNGSTDGTVTYNIIPYNGGCVGTQTTITITVKPLPVTALPGPDEAICASSTYTLRGNSPGAGTGRWTVVSNQTGVSFSDPTNPNAVVSGLQPGNIYQFRWTITAAPTCPPSTGVVTITVNAATVGGTTAGAATVCAGTNSGTVTLSGNVGNVLRWESSTDGGTTWAITDNTSTSITYQNLNQTTQYRAIVQNGSCASQASSATTITVNPPAVVANAGADQTLCSSTSVTLDGNDAGTSSGLWTQLAGPAVTFVNPANPKTQVTGLAGGNTYRFLWTIKGLPPCADNSDEVIIVNTADVVASFTADKLKGCGPLTIQFTNTSSATNGVGFVWDFGDGTPGSNEVSPQHTFQPSEDGTDMVYNVSLNLTENCVVRPPVTATITVSPAIPVAAILPENLSGCGTFVLTVRNTSPGTNAQYDFYLYDGDVLVQHIVKTDKSTVQFLPISTPVTKVYNLYMEATNACGTKARSTEVPITVSPANFTPQMFIKNNVTKGCAPLALTFVNNTAGGDVYKYNIYDQNNAVVASLPAGRGEFPYTFITPGVYYVSITATSDCASAESDPKIRVEVYTVPAPDFDADVKTGCRSIRVNFANLTPAIDGVPASALSYEWDFGDGTQSNSFSPPTHVYDFKKSPYTVRLTVTNLATGCTNTVVKQNFIVIESPPGTEFEVKPGLTTSIPNYTFTFNDRTTGSNLTSWRWNFGDGRASLNRYVTHTYADTGKYVVTLIVTNALGCDSTITKTVQVTGVPGQLYLPNAFTPNSSNPELSTFSAKGSGIASWHMQIFNNWGQLVFETTKLDSRGQPTEGWDGNFKGAQAPQGVYIWQVSAKFINGTDWKGMSYNGSLPKRSGVIHLIR
ncbi:PKD domain-containing protein [Mucilaginibacter pallidiroseus]|uniref:PKD domain-containing protein n=1 Tax=Mucilaginibacter pallidiroseus TaxID=2599295 RepID=A0A563UIZ6_9SPHI|nr:PKD domain-containing protein [Mucilaginibacter pallidiroseus]TWR31311.1 PKD domain-containing protein [Mucilaginibacter pallidiroseus]